MAPTQILLEGVGLAGLLLAAVVDLKSRIIPNTLVMTVVAAGLMLRLTEDGRDAWQGFVIAALVFTPLAVLAVHGVIGGGDAKMIPAAVLLVDPARTGVLLTAIAFAGGLLSVGYLVVAACPATALRRGPILTFGLPYGLAILAGTVFTIARA
jgi:prepilin peptidase CpaA